MCFEVGRIDRDSLIVGCFCRKRRLHPIDILIEFSGFAVGALTCELAGESRASSL
jgi:hypothetical protein